MAIAVRASELSEIEPLREQYRAERQIPASTKRHSADEIAGAGGVLYHYNRPYGDVYMRIAEPFLRLGLGAYLVQELKAVCSAGGSAPAARCNVDNLPSRRTLKKAGFVPCGALIAGDLSTPFPKYALVFPGNRSLTVAALIGAARVSKRCPDTLANF